MLSKLEDVFSRNNEGQYANINAAALFNDSELNDIAAKVKLTYDTDLTTLQTKFEELNKVMDLAMIITEQKTYPWPNASNIIYPLIANAAINFGANCYPEIIQDGEVVKAKIIGKDDGEIITVNGEKQIDPATGQPQRQGAGEKLKRGNRVATMMNWQLLEQMDWWENDIDKEVHSLPILGTMYKKVYYDPLRRMPVSELIFPHKIIVNNGARDLQSTPVSQIIELYPQEILERVKSGYYVNFDYDIEDAEAAMMGKEQTDALDLPRERVSKDGSMNTTMRRFVEQHTWMDLDKDGFLEPWIITVDLTLTKTVRIVPRFKERDVKRNKKGEVESVKACQYFVIRRFLPSFDGSFLGVGFGHLLYNMNHGINNTLNQMIDAGHLSITGGGFVSNLKMRGGRIALSPNEYKMLPGAVSGSLADNFYSPPKPEPSPVLFTLLGTLIETAKETGSMRDVLTGEIAANVAPTTMMSLIDQGSKQYKSIDKRYKKSLKEEFRLFYDINSDHLTDQEYGNILDEDADMVSVKYDFDQRSYDIVPISDSGAINSMQKYAQASFLMQFLQDPFVDGLKLRKDIFEIARIPTDENLVRMPQQAPDPTQIYAQAELIKAQNKTSELEQKAHELMADLEKKKYEIQNIEADIEVKRTQALKNIAEVELAHKGFSFKALDAVGEHMRANIALDADMALQQKAHELKEKQHEADVALQQQEMQQKVQQPTAI